LGFSSLGYSCSSTTKPDSWKTGAEGAGHLLFPEDNAGKADPPGGIRTDGPGRQDIEDILIVGVDFNTLSKTETGRSRGESMRIW
jgi:hypothetical protein